MAKETLDRMTMNQMSNAMVHSLTGFHSPVCHWGHFLPTLHDFSVAGLFPAFCKHSASSSGFCSLSERKCNQVVNANDTLVTND